MIKSNELRIGNLFIDLKGSTYMAEPGSVQKVYSIVSSGVNEYRDMGFPPDECKFEDMEPIPITEEWLIRFGFEKNEWYGVPNFYGHFNNGIDYYKDSTSIRISLGDDVCNKGVHWFQNWYYFETGEELELNEKAQ